MLETCPQWLSSSRKFSYEVRQGQSLYKGWSSYSCRVIKDPAPSSLKDPASFCEGPCSFAARQLSDILIFVPHGSNTTSPAPAIPSTFQVGWRGTCQGWGIKGFTLETLFYGERKPSADWNWVSWLSRESRKVFSSRITAFPKENQSC